MSPFSWLVGLRSAARSPGRSQQGIPSSATRGAARIARIAGVHAARGRRPHRHLQHRPARGPASRRPREVDRPLRSRQHRGRARDRPGLASRGVRHAGHEDVAAAAAPRRQPARDRQSLRDAEAAGPYRGSSSRPDRHDPRHRRRGAARVERGRQFQMLRRKSGASGDRGSAVSVIHAVAGDGGRSVRHASRERHPAAALLCARRPRRSESGCAVAHALPRLLSGAARVDPSEAAEVGRDRGVDESDLRARDARRQQAGRTLSSRRSKIPPSRPRCRPRRRAAAGRRGP